MQNSQKTLIVIPAIHSGGVEHGYDTLLRRGFFQGSEVRLVALCRGSGLEMYDRLNEAVGVNTHNQSRLTHLVEGFRVEREQFPQVAWRLKKEIDEFKPDTMLLSLSVPIRIGSFVAGFYPKLKVVAFEHMGNRHNVKGQKARKLLYRRVNALFVDSMDALCARGGDYPRAISHSALEVPLIATGKLDQCLQDRLPAHIIPMRHDGRPTFRLLSVGRLDPQKNYESSIKAIGLLRDAGYDVHLSIAGHGDDGPQLEKLTRDLRLSAHVRFLGFVGDRTSLSLHRQEADALLHAGKHEGLCLAVMEAMADGLPVIGSNVGGMKQLGIDGYNMFKITGPTEHQIASAIKSAIHAGPETLRRIQVAARRSVSQHFGEEAINVRWSAARRILNAHSSHPDAPRSPATQNVAIGLDA